MSKIIAKIRKDGVDSFRGEAKLWELNRRVTIESGMKTRFVVTSAVCAYSGPETYIFPTDSKGEVTSWGELPGSFQGGLDHEEAIKGFLEYCNR